MQYPEAEIQSIDALLDIPVTGRGQTQPVPLRSLATLTRNNVPSEITHYNIQPTIELSMSIDGRSLGEVSDDVALMLDKHGLRNKGGFWAPYDPKGDGTKTLAGSKIVLSGEYARMQETFRNLGVGLLLASLLMYFLMVGLDRSWIVPLTVMLVVPVSLGGVLPMLYFTGTALNVQSLLGIIFVVGIKVANTVLMTDFAQELRRHEGLSPTEAIRKAAIGASSAGDDDGVGRVLCHDPGCHRLGTRQRGECSAGPGDSRRLVGRRAGDLVRAAGALILSWFATNVRCMIRVRT